MGINQLFNFLKKKESVEKLEEMYFTKPKEKKDTKNYTFFINISDEEVRKELNNHLSKIYPPAKKSPRILDAGSGYGLAYLLKNGMVIYDGDSSFFVKIKNLPAEFKKVDKIKTMDLINLLCREEDDKKMREIINLELSRRI